MVRPGPVCALSFALAVMAIGLGCGPSDTVTPQLAIPDAGPGPSPARPMDAADSPVPPPLPDAAALDTPVVVPPDAEADAPAVVDRPPAPDLAADVALPPDLPPDLPRPPDLSPDLPPDLPPDTQPPGPWLMVAHAPGQAMTNLTAAGPIDWVHFGQGGMVSRVNRKMGGGMRITMTTVGASTLFSYDDRPVRFSWTDGTPVAQMPVSPHGISNGDMVGRGFELRIEGDPARARTARIYWGVWGGRAQFSARFSAGNVPPVTDNTLSASDPGADRITTISFRPATASQVLVVRWTVEAINLTYGNVTLQAAALAE